MSLQRISHFFDDLRSQNNNQLQEVRDRVRQLAKTTALRMFTEEIYT
jgi:hypothetical protein